MNQDEAIAKGNAYICACHSPTVRVRPFKFEDYNQYTVSYFWDKEDEEDDHLEVFLKVVYSLQQKSSLYSEKVHHLKLKLNIPNQKNYQKVLNFILLNGKSVVLFLMKVNHPLPPR